MKGYDLPAADDATTGGAVQAAHAHTGQVEHASLVFNLQCKRERALNRAQTEYRGQGEEEGPEQGTVRHREPVASCA